MRCLHHEITIQLLAIFPHFTILTVFVLLNHGWNKFYFNNNKQWQLMSCHCLFFFYDMWSNKLVKNCTYLNDAHFIRYICLFFIILFLFFVGLVTFLGRTGNLKSRSNKVCLNCYQIDIYLHLLVGLSKCTVETGIATFNTFDHITAQN